MCPMQEVRKIERKLKVICNLQPWDDEFLPFAVSFFLNVCITGRKVTSYCTHLL